jgi:hypothetical protein
MYPTGLAGMAFPLLNGRHGCCKKNENILVLQDMIARLRILE